MKKLQDIPKLWIFDELWRRQIYIFNLFFAPSIDDLKESKVYPAPLAPGTILDRAD